MVTFSLCLLLTLCCWNLHIPFLGFVCVNDGYIK
jgi:hypothetical protein